MRQISHFDLIFGALLGGLGLIGAIFAGEFRAGIVGTVFKPPVFVRIAVAVILACVGFSFIYSGLGSPAKLAPLENIGRSLLDIFFIVVAASVIIRAGISLFQNGKRLVRSQLKIAGVALVLAVVATLAILDLINRIHG